MKQFILPTVTATFLMVAAISPAFSAQISKPQAVDRRIHTLVYDPNEVYKFTGHYRYVSNIELAPDESVVSVSLGDALAWQIQTSNNRIFLKPIEQNATTNMTVITDKRIYYFELYAEEAEGIKDEDLIFSVRFHYPSAIGGDVQRYPLSKRDAPDIENEAEKFNFDYTVSGSEYITPLKVFDDGEFTYFEFKQKNAEIPAFFMVDSDGREAVINYRMTGEYVVVERVSSVFTLRHGSDVACVFNETLPLRKTPPKPKRKFLNLF